MDIFQYDFMIRAFIAGIVIALVTPCIGAVVVFKRFSMIGDTLSHASLAGVAAGLIGGINPIVGSLAACLAAAFGIEAVRKLFPKSAEIALAVILSAGVGLAGILTGFIQNAATFNSFLFGSIVAIGDFELFLVIAAGLIVFFVFIILYKALFYMVLDEETAKHAGVPVRRVNFIFTVLIALTISVSVRTIGVLIVSSLMVLPVASAMQIAGSYKQTTVFAVIFGIGVILSGLVLSYYAGLKPGGTIALMGVVFLALTVTLKKFLRALAIKLQGRMDKKKNVL